MDLIEASKNQSCITTLTHCQTITDCPMNVVEAHNDSIVDDGQRLPTNGSTNSRDHDSYDLVQNKSNLNHQNHHALNNSNGARVEQIHGSDTSWRPYNHHQHMVNLEKQTRRSYGGGIPQSNKLEPVNRNIFSQALPSFEQHSSKWNGQVNENESLSLSVNETSQIDYRKGQPTHFSWHIVPQSNRVQDGGRPSYHTSHAPWSNGPPKHKMATDFKDNEHSFGPPQRCVPVSYFDHSYHHSQPTMESFAPSMTSQSHHSGYFDHNHFVRMSPTLQSDRAADTENKSDASSRVKRMPPLAATNTTTNSSKEDSLNHPDTGSTETYVPRMPPLATPGISYPANNHATILIPVIHTFHYGGMNNNTVLQQPHAALPPYYSRSIVPLSTPNDEEWLSEFLCFVRSDCVEVFTARSDDVASRMNSKKILQDQVGIRCRFCAHIPHRERAGRSSSFPSSISRIYQSLTMMLRDHFPKCEQMPSSIKERYMSLKANASQGATDSKRYWTDSAHELGLIDTEGGGIRFNTVEEKHESITVANNDMSYYPYLAQSDSSGNRNDCRS